MDFIDFKNKYEHKEVIENNNSSPLKPKVSVCVQTYQHANYIKECLDGILSQKTDFDFEILLGEDDSSDGTREICVDYASRYTDKIRLFLHHRENNIKIRGQPTGRFNFLYDLYSSQGKYIALCEGDDYWTDPLKLQKQVDFLEKNEGYSMCFTHQLVVSKTGEVQSSNHYENKVYSTSNIIKGFIPGTQTILFRNIECLPQMLAKFSSSPSGDRMLAYCCSFFGDLHLLPEFTAAYRQTGEGVWTSFSKQKQFIFSLEEFIKFHLLIGLPANNEYVQAKINGAYPYLFKKDKKKFLENIRQVNVIKKKYKIQNHFFSYLINKISPFF